MESITRGECPAELDPGSRTQQVSVNLVRSEKPYEAPPKPKHRAFTGTGQTLAGELHPAADPNGLPPTQRRSIWSLGLLVSHGPVPRSALQHMFVPTRNNIAEWLVTPNWSQRSVIAFIKSVECFL